jgi:hypothetical protein
MYIEVHLQRFNLNWSSEIDPLREYIIKAYDVLVLNHEF